MPSDTDTYVADESRIDKSPRGKCYICGNPADFKVGIQDRKNVMGYGDTMVWKMLFI